ncbi:ROK family transcriptional regulator [Dehalococcoidia bacterium]|nr:ROK family transcriptional regulator [Dehalococcoidia bacterium]
MLLTVENQQLLRETNLVRVLLALKEDSPITKSAICSRLNLSRPTVDRAIGKLVRRELVEHDGHGPSQGGRCPLLYTFNRQARYAIGGDLELPELNLILCGLDGIPLASKGFTVPDQCIADPGKTLEFVSESVREMLKEEGLSLQRIVALGLGAPAFLNGDRITVFGRNLPSWTDVPVRAILEASLGVPVYVDNDANYMALAESHCMNYTDEVLVYVTLRRGIKGDIRMGSSVLIGGRVFHGAHGNAVSLQHAYVELGEDGQLERVLQEELDSSYDLKETASRMKDRLMIPILNLVTLFDPAQVVINAEILGRYEALFIKECEKILSTELEENLGWQVEVTRAQDRQFTCAKGAALSVLQDLFSRPEHLVERLGC